MSREGGGKRKSQSTKKAIIPELSKTEQERTLQQSAETSTVTKRGDSSSDIPQQETSSMDTNPNPLDRREGQEEESIRHVIAVSASKGPAAFFNLARKFLATDEMCDLSALEGAIVSAVDAAHLLERSKLATIERIQTSYVAVEPKRKKAPSAQLTSTATESSVHVPQESLKSVPTTSSETPILSTKAAVHARHAQGSHVSSAPIPSKFVASPSPAGRGKKSKGGASSEVRRARIMITVRRTPEYKQWLLDNPIPDTSTGDEEDPDVIEASMQPKV